MKKLLILMLVVIGFINAQAQSATLMPLVAGDTVSTSASLDTVFKTIPATGSYNTLGIQVNYTKISGTVASKAYLYSSLDGSNYNLTDSASAAFTNTAGTQAVWFTKTSVPYTYYKIQVRQPTSGGSTESGQVKVYYVFRRQY
jgi:hypothetical protein